MLHSLTCHAGRGLSAIERVPRPCPHPRHASPRRGRGQGAGRACAARSCRCSCSSLPAPGRVTSGSDPAIAQSSRSIDGGQFKAAEARIAEGLARSGESTEDTGCAFVPARTHAPHPARFHPDCRRRQGARAQADPRPARRRIREVGRGRPARAPGHRRPHAVFPSLAAPNLFRVSAQARARRQVQTPFVDGPMESPNAHHREIRDAALARAQHARRPAARARHADADGRCRRGARRRDRPRLDSVSACDRRASRKAITLRVERACATPDRARIRRCSARCTWKSPPHAGQPTAFSITYELTIYGQYHVDRSGQGRSGEDHAGTCAVRCRAPAACRVHQRDARILEAGRRRREESVSHRAEALRRGRPDPVGWRARIFDDLQHQRLRAARRPRRLRPADAAADHAAAAQRHSRALAVRHGLFGRRVRQPARLGLVVPGALRLGADGRDLRRPRRPATRRSRTFYLGGLDAYRIAFNDDYSRRSCPPSNTSAPKPSTCSAAKPNGAAATCISINGTTASRHRS